MSRKIKQFSKKRASLETRIRATKAKVVRDREHFCESCGRSDTKLSCSHTLSVNLFKQFADDPDNILLVCLDCHERIETWDISGMKCEDQIRGYVQDKAPEYYKRMENIQRLDQFLIVEDERMILTNNVNLKMFTDSRND